MTNWRMSGGHVGELDPSLLSAKVKRSLFGKTLKENDGYLYSADL